MHTTTESRERAILVLIKVALTALTAYFAPRYFSTISEPILELAKVLR